MSNVAFKEWAVVVDLLARGEQALILRKGGIHETRGGFEVEHRGFYLYPTLFHQQRESVKPYAQARYDQIAPRLPGADRAEIGFWAEAVETLRLTDWNAVARLDAFHCWTEPVIRGRFGWGKDEGIFAIVMRVSRLLQPRTIPALAQYGGCKSWIELEASAAPSLDGGKPVLDDSAFDEKIAEIRAALGR